MFCWPIKQQQEDNKTEERSRRQRYTPFLCSTLPSSPDNQNSAPSLVSTITLLKDKGNEFFKRKNYTQAIFEYSRALSYFVTGRGEYPTAGAVETIDDVMTSSCADQDQRVLLSVLLSNRSASYFHEAMFEKALWDAEAIIEVRPHWIKGHFRMGEALHGLDRLEEALEAFKIAQDLAPDPLIQLRIVRLDIELENRSNNLEIHQLIAGRDICHKSMLAPINSMIFEYAQQLQNYIYLIANRTTRECFVIDACWDIDGILEIAKGKGLKIVGALITHYHVDHIGGIPPPPFDKFNVRIEGIAKLIKRIPLLKCYAHTLEIPLVLKGNPELNAEAFTPLVEGSVLCLGDPNVESCVRIRAIHTPGHTPGSLCYKVERPGRLFSGDTLFVSSCGRLDFPDSSHSAMFRSLRKLSQLPPQTIVYAGHAYGGEFTSIGAEMVRGVLSFQSEDEFCEKVGMSRKNAA